mmetsp:Transcript_51707/g.52107  ORF Transcript_51707/g.52107 Transcript_51707/m.52107 type:complete len:91 (+) Transcript_51707:47-319(+)
MVIQYYIIFPFGHKGVTTLTTAMTKHSSFSFKKNTSCMEGGILVLSTPHPTRLHFQKNIPHQYGNDTLVIKQIIYAGKGILETNQKVSFC